MLAMVRKLTGSPVVGKQLAQDDTAGPGPLDVATPCMAAPFELAPGTPPVKERAFSRSRSPHGLQRSRPLSAATLEQAAPEGCTDSASHRRISFQSPRRNSTGAVPAGSRSTGARQSFSTRQSVGGARASIGQASRRASTATRLSGSFQQQVGRAKKAPAPLVSRKSFVHRDFANPYAETCWLSCLFQSLWHSTVFHAAFERDLASSAYVPGPEERILGALQRTWAEYKAGHEDAPLPVACDENAKADDPALVPAEDLAEGFGEGYGDMSEAVACIQQELSSSLNPAAVSIADLLALVPIGIGEEADDDIEGADSESEGLLWPSPARAWAQAVEWQVDARPLIAVDISLPELMPEECGYLARHWVPRGSALRIDDGIGASGGSASDMGSNHRIVALVCFMWNFRHYVAFCRRQSDPTRCIFFNDLPALTPGGPREIAWSEVPELCQQYSLAPRLALFEGVAAAATNEGDVLGGEVALAATAATASEVA